MKWFIYLILGFALVGCADKANYSTKELKENEKIFWVAGTMVDCIGVAKMNCIQVQEGNKIEDNNWRLLYNDIEGFEYEPGYLYKLIIKEEHLPKEQVPADASSIRYHLVKVLEKKRAM